MLLKVTVQSISEGEQLKGKALSLELVSTGSHKDIGGRVESKDGKDEYEGSITVTDGFGVGAVMVENEYVKEIFIKDIVLDGFPAGSVTINCNSWVQSKLDNPEKRVFFTNKSYLPSQTPKGLENLRRKDLEAKRGNGQGQRQRSERIYDYDVYNDLGDPDENSIFKRSVLGGNDDHPYPRRCRTGRPHCDSDTSSEKRKGMSWYIPRDESFSRLDSMVSDLNKLNIFEILVSQNFKSFDEIYSLFNPGLQVLAQMIPKKLTNFLSESVFYNLKFQIPETLNSDKFVWLSDKEFARQTLAGINPYSIRKVEKWPPKSTLDPNIYGNLESTITDTVVESVMSREGYKNKTIKEAIQHKKLFMLDYHDLLVPYVKKVRELPGTTLYGSRTLFFLTNDGTLTPIAIELTCPRLSKDQPEWKNVYKPSHEGTDKLWLWRLAKAHVLAHDSCYHQLVSHWLRTHSATEPYIIATNRQLSAMHPIYRLLSPHFRHTMEINVLARQKLISAGGLIELTFSPKKYSLELSAEAYKQWRFDKEGLPQDLIQRDNRKRGEHNEDYRYDTPEQRHTAWFCAHLEWLGME